MAQAWPPDTPGMWQTVSSSSDYPSSEKAGLPHIDPGMSLDLQTVTAAICRPLLSRSHIQDSFPHSHTGFLVNR